jgi:ribosomal protein S18 acetylase RimI-like enzyme
VADLVVPLTVRDLTHADLPSCAWSGSATRLVSMAAALDRVERGEVDYLCVCPPSGLPVGLGGVDYMRSPGAGTLWQLTVHPALQSLGIGTLLIDAAEHRIRARGLDRAELAVEERNPRAQALYERLDYVAYAREPEAWTDQTADGRFVRYETMCAFLRKDLRSRA